MTTAYALLVPLLLPSWLDPEVIITSLGNWALWGVALIVFAECGIFSILPGDSLLFAVGMFTALGTIRFGGGAWTTMAVVWGVLIAAAVLGNVSGYWIGRVIGPPLFKPRSGLAGKLFDPKHVERTHGFFEKYGSKALILARFIPLVRTFVTLIAGVSKMNWRSFISYSAVGGVAWVLIVTLAGYFLGDIPIIKNNFEAAAVVIVLVSVLPMAWEYVKHRRQPPAPAQAAAPAAEE
ncbi:MAG: VTT domain-containing protein [Propionibacteriaceae bacterium]|nr:VTT domain-containing protein [Propionibacteriaceae bacterium]